MTCARYTVTALVLCVTSTAYSQQKPIIKHVPPPDTNPTSGAEMYHAYCAVCHGVDGKGNGPAAPALRRTPPDLTLLTRKNGGQFPTFRVSNIITGDAAVAAHGSREMPMWGDVFRTIQGDEEIVKLRVHNLVEYIVSLQQK